MRQNRPWVVIGIVAGLVIGVPLIVAVVALFAT